MLALLELQLGHANVENKLLMGYAGWYATPGDGNPDTTIGWRHWFSAPQNPAPQDAKFTYWPDCSEYGAGELHDSPLSMADGHPAKLFSSYTRDTVDRHFSWMEEFGIDGVLKQRFIAEAVGDPPFKNFQNHVTSNVKMAAERHKRAWGILYDLYNANATTLVKDIQTDWVEHCENTLGALDSPQFVSYKGKPLIGLRFGIYDGHSHTEQKALTIVAFFQKRGMAVMGQVPTSWRSDPQWKALVNILDIINPWTVGKFGGQGGNDAGSPESAGIDADRYATTYLAPDLVATQKSGQGYMPTIWPGSYQLTSKTQRAYGGIPRFGGAFYWRQAANALALNATMLYNAMFDDVDDGTAMFKIAAHAKNTPIDKVIPRGHTVSPFLALDDDGLTLPTDWYLTLAGKVASALRQGQPLGDWPGAPKNWDTAQIAQAVVTGYAVFVKKEIPSDEICKRLDAFKKKSNRRNLTAMFEEDLQDYEVVKLAWTPATLTTQLYQRALGRQPSKAERADSEKRMTCSDSFHSCMAVVVADVISQCASQAKCHGTPPDVSSCIDKFPPDPPGPVQPCVIETSTRARPAARVQSLAWGADGTIVSAQGSDLTGVKVWNSTMGRLVGVGLGHTSSVTAVAYRPDGKWFVSGSVEEPSGGPVRLWDASSWDGTSYTTVGAFHYSFKWSGTSSIAFRPGMDHKFGWLIAVGSKNLRDLLIINTSQSFPLTWPCLKCAPTSTINSIDWSPDGTKLASGNNDFAVRIWDFAAQNNTRELKGHALWVYGVSWSPDGLHIASGSFDKTIRIWDTNTWESKHTLNCTSEVNSVRFSPDGQHLAAGLQDGTVITWDATTFKQLAVLHGHSESVNTVSFSHDGDLLASGSSDQTIRTWQVGTWKCSFGGSMPGPDKQLTKPRHIH